MGNAISGICNSLSGESTSQEKSGEPIQEQKPASQAELDRPIAMRRGQDIIKRLSELLPTQNRTTSKETVSQLLPQTAHLTITELLCTSFWIHLNYLLCNTSENPQILVNSSFLVRLHRLCHNNTSKLSPSPTETFSTCLCELIARGQPSPLFLKSLTTTLGPMTSESSLTALQEPLPGLDSVAFEGFCILLTPSRPQAAEQPQTPDKKRQIGRASGRERGE